MLCPTVFQSNLSSLIGMEMKSFIVSQCHGFTVLHCYIVKSSQYYSVTLLHCYSVILQCYSVTASQCSVIVLQFQKLLEAEVRSFKLQTAAANWPVVTTAGHCINLYTNEVWYSAVQCSAVKSVAMQSVSVQCGAVE